MSETVKTVLIVGGVAVGVVVLMKALTPTSPQLTTTKLPTSSRPTDVISLNSIFSLGAAALSAWGTSKPQPVPNEGTYRVDTQFTVSGNELRDDSGKTLVYGTD